MRIMVRLKLGVLAIGAAMLGAIAGGQQAPAAEWPTKPIEMVCATSAGSGAANWCQLFAKLAGDALGQPVQVLFKGGGNGNEAAEYVASRPNDGYTWLQRNSSYAGYMNLPSFKPNPEDFVNVVNVEKFLYIIGVPGDSKYKTFEGLIADMKANPGRISVAGNKIGSAHHVHLVKLFKAFGVDWNFVPYKGSGGAMKDTLGGHVPVAIGPPGIWMPHVEAGKARFLLLLNEEHVDRPGLADLKIPGDFGKEYQFRHQIQGMFVTRGTPADVQEKIASAFETAVGTAEYKAYIGKNSHVVPVFSGDTKANTTEFHSLRADIRVFLTEAGLIK